MTRYLVHSEPGRRWTPWAPSIVGTKEDVPAERAAELVVLLASGRADRLSGRYLRVFDDVAALIRGAEDGSG